MDAAARVEELKRQNRLLRTALAAIGGILGECTDDGPVHGDPSKGDDTSD